MYSVPGKMEVIVGGHALEVRVSSLGPSTQKHAQLFIFKPLDLLKITWLIHMNIPV